MTILRYAVFGLLFLFNGISIAQTPTWLWAKSAGYGGYNTANAIAVDSSGNIYVAGNFSGSTITFGSTTLSNLGESDIFLVKYDVDGNVLWAKSAGGIKTESANSIALDPLGNIYLTGAFESDSCPFGYIPTGYITLWKHGNGDVFLAKYDTDGNLQWAKNDTIIYGAFGTTPSFVSVDVSGNAYISAADIFIAKYNTNGDVLWFRKKEGTASNLVMSSTVDASGNIFIAGIFYSPTLTLGTIVLTNKSVSSFDIFLAKYDSGGNVLWAKNYGGSESEIAHSLKLDIFGNIYLAGYFDGSQTEFDSIILTNAEKFYADLFLAKFDANGKVLWAKSAGGKNSERANSVVVDDKGNVFLTGYFESSAITFDSYTLTNTGRAYTKDIFLSVYNVNGNILWAENAEGASYNGSSAPIDDFGECITEDGSGNIYLAGGFNSSILSFGYYSLEKSDIWGWDMFLAKLSYSSLGISKLRNSSNVSVYPNPTTDLINIETPELPDFSELTIIDVSNKELITHHITGPKTQIDIRSLPSGIYIIKLSGQNAIQTLKIVKD